jgi:hypothetical protein
MSPRPCAPGRAECTATAVRGVALDPFASPDLSPVTLDTRAIDTLKHRVTGDRYRGNVGIPGGIASVPNRPPRQPRVPGGDSNTHCLRNTGLSLQVIPHVNPPSSGHRSPATPGVSDLRTRRTSRTDGVLHRAEGAANLGAVDRLPLTWGPPGRSVSAIQRIGRRG